MNLRAKSISIKAEAQKAVRQCENGEITVAELTPKMARLERDDKELAEALKSFNSIPTHLRGGGGAGSGRNENGDSSGMFTPTPPGMRTKGAQAVPLGFDENELRAMHEAVSHRQSYALKTKAFNSVDSLLPAQLQPWVVGPQYEGRLLDHLPVQPIEAPSLEYIVHTGTIGPPAIVPEGGVKPEVTFNTESVIATPQKIAGNAATTWEQISDWDRFVSYVQQELTRQVINVENAELIAGAGTTGYLHGFLSTSGILVHDASADTGTDVTALDSVEMSIAQLRTGAALAEANLLVLHPNTFWGIRRLKNTLGNF